MTAFGGLFLSGTQTARVRRSRARSTVHGVIFAFFQLPPLSMWSDADVVVDL